MLPQVQERLIREAFDRRDVKMNGVRVKRDTPAVAGADIKIYLSDEGILQSPEILYEDPSFMIVYKPVGMSCVLDGKGGMTIGAWVYQAFADRLPCEPMPCHRLDNPTDGLLVMAKDEHALTLMENAFYRHQVHKRYTCLVQGEPKPAHATLEAYLVKNAEQAQVRIVQRPIPGALPIRTEYRVLSGGEVSRLEIILHTGRTHQIRAQLASIGHPLLGDDKYGDRTWNREQHAKRLMLCATDLTFTAEGDLSYLNDQHIFIKPTF